MTRYPHMEAALERLLGPAVAGGAAPASAAPNSFAVGPAVLRPPPTRVTAPPAPSAPDEASPEAMLGELLDMVFVSADDGAAGAPREHEVHLVFKAEVLGGLHLRLQKKPDGLFATFVVEDAHARRAVSDAIDGLLTHLRGRGFAIIGHQVQLAEGA